MSNEDILNLFLNLIGSQVCIRCVLVLRAKPLRRKNAAQPARMRLTIAKKKEE